MVLPLVPSLFLLDHMGITTKNPLLWIGALVPLALAEVVVSINEIRSEPVWHVLGSKRFHTEYRCSALQRASAENRILFGRVTVERMGAELCRTCRHTAPTP